MTKKFDRTVVPEGSADGGRRRSILVSLEIPHRCRSLAKVSRQRQRHRIKWGWGHASCWIFKLVASEEAFLNGIEASYVLKLQTPSFFSERQLSKSNRIQD